MRSIAFFDAFHGKLEQACLNGFFHKTGDVTFLCASLGQKGAQSSVSFFRYDNGPADILHGFFYLDFRAYEYICLLMTKHVSVLH